MGRSLTPREYLELEHANVSHGGVSIIDSMASMTLHLNGEDLGRVHPDREIALRKEFPLLGKLVDKFMFLYVELTGVDGGVDYLHEVDNQLAHYVETLEGNDDSFLFKWFNGELDSRFYYSERNEAIFVSTLVEAAKERTLTGEERAYAEYKQEWYKSHGVSPEDVYALREDYEMDVSYEEFEGSFEEYELEYGYHGGEVYACFDEFLDNEYVCNDWSFVASKSVLDSDGFQTDYTWYSNADGTQVFVFGDNDIYKPEDGYFDHICDSENEAREWFDSYKGFENIDETEDISEIEQETSEDNAKNSNFKEWYISEFPDDEMGSRLNSDVTFANLYECLELGEDIYDALGVGDSEVRGRAFSKLAELYGVDYMVIYDKWMDGPDSKPLSVESVIKNASERSADTFVGEAKGKLEDFCK